MGHYQCKVVSGANVAGHRLLRHPRIARRIAEIEAETARLHSRGPEVLIGKLETVYRRAIVDHQFHTAARAVELQARIQGIAAGSAGAGGDASPESCPVRGAESCPRARPADGDLRAFC